MMQFDLSDDEPELKTLDISNDYYYRPLSERAGLYNIEKPAHSTQLLIPKYGSETIRHSLPAYDLWKAFFPTYLSEVKFKNFHRPRLRHYNNGPQARNRWGRQYEHPVKNLSRHMYRNHTQLKNRVIKAINERVSRQDIESKFLLIKEARELSAKDGELYMFEYSEEYPPVLSQVGMASNIKNYLYQPPKNLSKGSKSPGAKELVDSQVSPNSAIGYDQIVKTEPQAKNIYYNSLKPGSKTCFIENNLYRAPIYKHEFSNCDFLVVRTRNNYYIREVKTIYTVGQTLPLSVVPPPNDTCIQRFRCDLSNLYIHKLFKASPTDPPSLDLDKLLKLFPDYHRSVLKTRISKNGTIKGFIKKEAAILKGTSKYGEVSLRELRNMLHPEDYCKSMSMLAARQRLRELNYTETMIFPDKGQTVELEPEVLAAPWNTTQAVVSVLKNQAYLDLERHLIDPTGPAREGFSCAPWVKSPTEVEQAKQINKPTSAQQPIPKNGPLQMRNPLREKIIHEKLNRLAIFKKAAEMIAGIQSDVLSSHENLSSSEGESDAEFDNENLTEADFSRQLDDLSRLVIGNRTVNELSHEREEEERRQMLADLRLNGQTTNGQDQAVTKEKPDNLNLAFLKNKILMITRTYDHNGSKIQRTEIVREPRIMALYVKKRGGSLTNKVPSEDDACDSSLCGGDANNITIGSIRSEGATPHRSSSLGPSELCRTDGTRIRISKKVLECVRPMRRQATTAMDAGF